MLLKNKKTGLGEVRGWTAGLHIKNPVMCGLYDWINTDGSRYFVFLYRADEFEGTLQSSAEGIVRWIRKEDFLEEKLAQGMEAVFRIINSDGISECFWDKGTLEEIIR